MTLSNQVFSENNKTNVLAYCYSTIKSRTAKIYVVANIQDDLLLYSMKLCLQFHSRKVNIIHLVPPHCRHYYILTYSFTKLQAAVFVIYVHRYLPCLTLYYYF